VKTACRDLFGMVAPVRTRLLVATALMAATIGAGVALMGTSTWLIATAAGHPSIAVLQVAVVGVRGLGIGRAVLRYLERLVSHDATLRVLARIRSWVFEKAVPLAPAGFVGLHSADVFGRMVSDVEALDQAYLRIAGPTAAAFVVTGVMVLVLVRVDVAIAVAAAVGFALAGLVVPAAAARAGRRCSQEAVLRLARLQVAAVDTVQGLADLLSLGRHVEQAHAIERSARALASAQLRAARRASAGSAIAGLAADATVVAVLALATDAAHHGRTSGVSVAVATLLALASFEAVSGLPAAYQRIGGLWEAARRLCGLAEMAPAVVAPARPRPLPAGRSIDVVNLTFAYPQAGGAALRDVSLSLLPGRATVVVGPSGSGKSTLISLLLRFWDVPDGTVFLDGVDVRSLDPDGVRSRCALVSQRTHLFTGTIRENLLLARPSATDDEIVQAATRAGLHGLVASWPRGYDTWVGEQGHQMSGGERRRLALARALLQDAPVLLLDEPTADLDPEHEHRILQEIGHLARDRSVLLVTHRLARLAAFSDIHVLDEGRVVERGSYASLSSAGGRFQSMLEAHRAVAAVEQELGHAS
jgi:thiol reductant ABC exporter CydC subunit